MNKGVRNGGKCIAHAWSSGRMNFLLNMNVNHDMTAKLKGRGHICRPVGDIGMSRAKDIEIVAEAKRANEVIPHGSTLVRYRAPFVGRRDCFAIG